MAPNGLQNPTKMVPKRTPRADFPRFPDILFFDNTTMVLLCFRDPKGSPNRFFRCKIGCWSRSAKTSLKNRVFYDFVAKKGPKRDGSFAAKSVNFRLWPPLAPKVAPGCPKSRPGVPKVTKKSLKVEPKTTKK